MQLFYQQLYPFKSIFQWLNHKHAPSKLFMHHEFAFMLLGDIYLCYNLFISAEQMGVGSREDRQVRGGERVGKWMGVMWEDRSGAVGEWRGEEGVGVMDEGVASWMRAQHHG